MKPFRGGFTLLEMVVSISVMALVALALAVAFRVSFGSMERGEEEALGTARLRAGIGLLIRAIRSADPSGIPADNGAIVTYFSGNREKLMFLSAAPVSAVSGGGCRLLSFYGGKDPPVTGMIISEASPFRAEGAEGWEGTDRARFIIRTAEGVFFSYSPGPSKEGTWEWVESWDAKDKGVLPAAVRVEFTTASERGPLKTSFVVPVPAGGGS